MNYDRILDQLRGVAGDIILIFPLTAPYPTKERDPWYTIRDAVNNLKEYV